MNPWKSPNGAQPEVDLPPKPTHKALELAQGATRWIESFRAAQENGEVTEAEWSMTLEEFIRLLAYEKGCCSEHQSQMVIHLVKVAVELKMMELEG